MRHCLVVDIPFQIKSQLMRQPHINYSLRRLKNRCPFFFSMSTLKSGKDWYSPGRSTRRRCVAALSVLVNEKHPTKRTMGLALRFKLGKTNENFSNSTGTVCANNVHSWRLMEKNPLNGSNFLLLMDKRLDSKCSISLGVITSIGQHR